MSDIKEVVRIDGIDVLLDDVRYDLRRDYESAHRAVETRTGVAKNQAKAEVTRLAKQILQEALPGLALKHSPRSYGSRGFFQALARRTA